MPHSQIINGQVYDYQFKSLPSGMYAFYLVKDDDRIFVGQVQKNILGWTCIPEGRCDFSPIDGFKTRFLAAQLLLKLAGFQKKEKPATTVETIVEEILEDIESAIRKFGTYSYYDKGAHEVMHMEKYVDEFKKMGADTSIKVLTSLYGLQYEHMSGFISSLLSFLDSWDGEEGDKFFNSDIVEICQDM